MKRKIIVIVLCFFITRSFSQVQSPEQFLGYKIGTRYTPHYQIVNYFHYVATAVPSVMKLQQYGETNEHRPLLAAFISSEQNIANLENIRTNNLSMAHIVKKTISSEPPPAIVWLSYNVHGNETSSSEASMLTLFSLIDPSNTQAKKWMNNTVVIIDPCLNPDGRDRYINWYNTVVGKNYNPVPIAREHREPWPGGRSNHYNYDLNRDWVWQTQVESRSRLKLYNQWLPQVHVDFHEQGINSPYYFAPAAEPYHEVITQWQRDFQKLIGKNNAKYFDKNGWLYFTNERFDLFYPSYGDTYPLYNGAIGMTYEQGGISAGLGIITDAKDTLTLAARVLHHYTSGISTIQTASENAGRLTSEFQKYFDNAVNGNPGQYKTYVIKNTPQDIQRIHALTELLDNNNIQYGRGAGKMTGYDYNTKKETSITINPDDIVISAYQPKATLVKVLFEPESKLVDSVTYDITAWALPYAYGLTSYASKQKIDITSPFSAVKVVNTIPPSDAYGVVLPWNGTGSAKVVGALLQKEMRLRFSEVPFTSSGQQFGRGSVIITKNGNEKFADDLWKIVTAVCNDNNIKLNVVTSGLVEKGADFGSNRVHLFRPVRVAMLTGDGVSSTGAGEIWDFFDNTLQYPLTLINAADFNRFTTQDFDVLILPDGRYDILKNEAASEGLKKWVDAGGKLIVLENAVAQISKLEWSDLKEKKDSTHENLKKDPYRYLQPYDERERDEVTESTPGSIYKVEADNTHPLMFGYPDYYYTLKLSPEVYEFIKTGGWNVGYLKKENYMAGYVGHKLFPNLKDGLLFGVQQSGRGTITYLADDVLFRNFWENGKLMLCNAVFLVGE